MDLNAFVGRLTADETLALFHEVVTVMPNQTLLEAINEVLSDGDKEELMARWEEPSQEEKA